MNSSLQSHQLFEHLAKKPIDNVTFPIHLNVVMKIRDAINDPKSSTKLLTDIIKAEPMISARIIQSANSASSHGYVRILDVEKAVMKLGNETIRRTTLAVAMAQLARSKDLLVFSSLSRRIWLHSLYTASASYVIAKEYTNINPDEALFSGLMLNIGAFYFLWLASRLPGSDIFIDDVRIAIDRHYLVLTHGVLKHMSMPKELLQSLEIHAHTDQILLDAPTTIQEIIYAANVLASAKFPWIEEDYSVEFLSPLYTKTIPLIEQHFTLLREEYN